MLPVKPEYVPFFELIPIYATLTLRQVVPSKYKVVDTNILACVFAQHLLFKKSVMDSLKDSAEKYSARMLKRNKDEDCNIVEIADLELSQECEILINNFNYFKNRYGDKVTSEVITNYITYVMATNEALLSHQFFESHLYAKDKETVRKSLISSLEPVTGITMTEIEEFGEYLTDPLLYKHYSCFGRESEIQESVDILCRMYKSNVLLVGEAGVGKTSIVYGICNYLQSDKCPESLKDMIVFQLNVTKLISGTTYRGDLEKRVDSLIDCLKQSKNIILFIDEIHSIFNDVSDSSSSKSTSIQNMLKPYMSENSYIIGCTTNKEYKVIESDKAFERRFSVVRVGELQKEETIKLLNSKKSMYKNFHKVDIDENIVEYVTDMCDIYLKNLNFPDKAFDVIDRSCVICKNDNRDAITNDDVDVVIYKMSGINPKSKNVAFVKGIENNIKKDILGQDKAIGTAMRCFYRYYAGVNDKTKPIGKMLLVGPTGVGKTELCKQLAKNFFNSKCFIRYDMSEFMESHSVSKIIGSPPGYVGYNVGGALTDKVQHNPFSIILFDEIEKAHKDVVNILLQIMDDGRLTNSKGDTIDFCNCVIVMTSNLGCKEVTTRTSIGFNSQNNDNFITNAINDFFRPEFLNRLDDVIMFNKISYDVFEKILEKEINAKLELYKDHGFNIELTDADYKTLKDTCYDEKNGVRFIKKKVSDYIENIVFNDITT